MLTDFFRIALMEGPSG